MFDWLFEGRASVYVILAALIVFLVLVWRQTRKRWCLIAVVVVALVVGLYALLHRLVETDREQIARKINAMAAAANARDLDALMENVSERFHSPQGKNKQQLRDILNTYLNGGMVGNIRTWDIEFAEAPSRQHPPVKVFFRAKAESGRELLSDCEATFDFDARRGWRLLTIRLLKPQMTEEWPIQL